MNNRSTSRKFVVIAALAGLGAALARRTREGPWKLTGHTRSGEPLGRPRAPGHHRRHHRLHLQLRAGLQDADLARRRCRGRVPVHRRGEFGRGVGPAGEPLQPGAAAEALPARSRRLQEERYRLLLLQGRCAVRRPHRLRRRPGQQDGRPHLRPLGSRQCDADLPGRGADHLRQRLLGLRARRHEGGKPPAPLRPHHRKRRSRL